MTDYRFGDVVLVPFPFTDQSDAKRRPAVAVSSNAYHDQRLDLILMAITSQIRSPLGFGESLVTHWQEAGLLKPSVLKPVLFTLDKALVVRKLGSLSGQDAGILQQSLATILGGSEANPSAQEISEPVDTPEADPPSLSTEMRERDGGNDDQ